METKMDPQRVIAIGDVHGCLRPLETLLAAIQPGPDDLVVALGDLIDRGPDSRGVVQRMIELSATTQMVLIRGNHEEMMLAVVDRLMRPEMWLRYGGSQTLDSYGFTDSLDCIPADHLELLRSSRDWHEIDGYFFVHANYDPDLPLDQQPPEKLRWESLLMCHPGAHCSGKVAIVGHTANQDGEVYDCGYLRCIDTYCYGGRWLTAMDVLTGQIWQANPLGELRTP